jgi:XapX domain-containing protein
MSNIRPRTRQAVNSALISLVGGALAGTVFWALHARSPAPPWLGLTGLLGIVLGERAVIGLRDRHRAGRRATERTAGPEHTETVGRPAPIDHPEEQYREHYRTQIDPTISHTEGEPG